MIGSGLKKMAQENGMKVARGVAYGALRGFAATLCEGAGWKQVVFTVRFPDPAQMDVLAAQVNQINIERTYRIQALNITGRTIQIVFHDNPGTMKKIREFLDWFIPMLEQHGVTGADVCTECGCDLTNGRWVLVNGVAFHVHDSCAQKIAREIEEDNSQLAQQGEGSYAMGTLGAFLGAAIGALIWAVVLNMGFVASIVGLVIGWLAEKGYNLLRGKQGKGKVAILILAVIFGVLLGTFGADAITLAQMIGDGELPGFAMSDIPMMILSLLVRDSEYLGATVENILMGLLFAGLGAFALLRKTGADVAGIKYIVLE